MKKIFLISFLYLVASVANAQLKTNSIACSPDAIEYRPFVENGKQWLVVCATHEVFWTKKYYIAEDTMIDNRTCKKLMCRTVDYEKGTDVTELFSMVFEEGKKVYYYNVESTIFKPILLYDFGANVDDVVLLGGQRENTSEQVSYLIQEPLVLENNGECFRGMQASLKDEEPINIDGEKVYSLFQWYEGIGSIFEPFEKTTWNKYMSGPLYRLYECRVNDDIIYSKTMGLILANDLVNNVSNTSVNKVFNNGQIFIFHNGKRYNLLGAEVK